MEILRVDSPILCDPNSADPDPAANFKPAAIVDSTASKILVPKNIKWAGQVFPNQLIQKMFKICSTVGSKSVFNMLSDSRMFKVYNNPAGQRSFNILPRFESKSKKMSKG